MNNQQDVSGSGGDSGSSFGASSPSKLGGKTKKCSATSSSTKTSSGQKPPHHMSIISLSKLKEYMPQNQATAQLFHLNPISYYQHDNQNHSHIYHQNQPSGSRVYHNSAHYFGDHTQGNLGRLSRSAATTSSTFSQHSNISSDQELSAIRSKYSRGSRFENSQEQQGQQQQLTTEREPSSFTAQQESIADVTVLASTKIANSQSFNRFASASITTCAGVGGAGGGGCNEDSNNGSVTGPRSCGGKIVKEVESSELATTDTSGQLTQNQASGQQHRQLSNRSPLEASSELHKARRKIDSSAYNFKTAKGQDDDREDDNGEAEAEQSEEDTLRGKGCQNSSVRSGGVNNMTPSSLLLIHNYTHADQLVGSQKHQQQSSQQQHQQQLHSYHNPHQRITASSTRYNSNQESNQTKSNLTLASVTTEAATTSNIMSSSSHLQGRMNQYYNDHYSNLIPTISSKSSSPKSANSTPSPKTSNSSLHIAASIAQQPSNQIIAASGLANPTSAPTHLVGHLNQHYMGTPPNVVNLGQTQQAVQHSAATAAGQHYSAVAAAAAYNQQAQAATGNVAGGDAGQHHQSIMSTHEQIYAQQQQQHQQQLQQQQQQHQHQQILQQQQQQQQHHNQQQQIQQHEHQQQQQQSQQQQHHPSVGQQRIYHHLANNGVSVGSPGIYAGSGNAHYQSHLTGNGLNGGQSTNHLIADAQHQSHLNNTAAACAAAAVVSQTLKSVTNQHQNHSQHYGTSAQFPTTNEGLMNISVHNHHHPQHNQQSIHTHPGALVNHHSFINHHHHHQQQASRQNTQAPQHQHHSQQSLSIGHATSLTTRKYQCKMCPQVFMSKAEMKYHNQNHMREAKPYKCLQCPKAFANSSYLSQHMRIHQGVKPYTCDICTRKFTQLSHLQQHKRTHTGDKPYKCNYLNCTKQFSQLSNLQSHSRCHQLDKPYKCNSCYKCFHDEPSLLEHIPRHLESKHLKKNLCIFCGSSYQQERGLVKHFQQYHTDKSPTLVAAAIAAGTTGNTNLIASLVSSKQTTNVFATPLNSGGTGNAYLGSSSSASSSCSLSSSSGSSTNVNHNYTTMGQHGQPTSYIEHRATNKQGYFPT